MFSYHEAASLMDTSAFHSPVSSALTISLHTAYRYISLYKFRITFFLCMCADIRIGMQLQQRGDGAVSDGGEAAAHPDEAAQGEHKHNAPRTDTCYQRATCWLR